MIDTVHVRVPALTPFAPGIGKSLEGLQNGHFRPFGPSRFYESVGSLREDFGIDAILHLGYKRGKHANKVEIIGAGKKSLAEMEETIKSVFDLDPKPLMLMRADFAGDIPNVPVHQVRDSGRFDYKRFASQINKVNKDELEFIAMGTAISQSFYVGRRPNCIRVYNKFEELRHKWARLKRDCDRFNEGLDHLDFTPEERQAALRIAPTFEEYCLLEGFHYNERAILTRIERQIGGDKFPDDMQTFGDLYHANHFDPYEGMELVECSETLPIDSLPDGVSIRDVLAARGLLGFREDFGNMQHALSFVKKHAKGNGRRILDTILPILRNQRPLLTKADVLDAYTRTTERQIVGKESIVYT